MLEYLPLKFSRRHGDPSRLDYQGNWRDIFQNWEALGAVLPGVHREDDRQVRQRHHGRRLQPVPHHEGRHRLGSPEPDNPGRYIGYWGDHQIIYLLKLLECRVQDHPGALWRRLPERPSSSTPTSPTGSSRTRSCSRIRKNTIDYDDEREKVIEQKVAAIGADGKLVRETDDAVHLGQPDREAAGRRCWPSWATSSPRPASG